MLELGVQDGTGTIAGQMWNGSSWSALPLNPMGTVDAIEFRLNCWLVLVRSIFQFLFECFLYAAQRSLRLPTSS